MEYGLCEFKLGGLEYLHAVQDILRCPVWRHDECKLHAVFKSFSLSAPTMWIVTVSSGDCYADPDAIKVIAR
jgi:hypothetical protein